MGTHETMSPPPQAIAAEARRPRESTESSWLGQLRLIAADIKLAHSVFAMPFALLAAFMAAPRVEEKNISVLANSSDARVRFLGQLTLIVLAMVFARTVAMLSNRLLDREIDARNPRTVNRAVASGRLRVSRAIAALGACVTLFLVVCAAFGIFFNNWWPIVLGPFVLL